MAIPYRTKRTMIRVLVAICILLVIAALIWVCWAVWLGRFMVYTRNDGVRLDFDKNANVIEGEPISKPQPLETVPIFIHDGTEELVQKTELNKMKGYYVETSMLQEDLSQIMPQVRQLEKGTPVMIDIKSIYGNYFYSSKVSTERNEDLDISAMDTLLRELNRSGAYTIARLPAFRDFKYGLSHVADGLPTAGGYLWMDEKGCYWLNPATQGTIDYLVQIITELRSMGFDEVVLYDFCFPQTTQIVFNEDQGQALSDAAKKLVEACTTENFAVSFVGDSSFPLPEGRCRLYVENAAAADAQTIANALAVADPSIQLVFLTELHDTRFEEYSVLRPLSGAH